MKMDIVNLKEKRTQLDNIIASADINSLNLYNQFSHLETCWHDNNSERFMNRIDREREQTRRKISDLEEMSKLFKFIETEYEKIGKKIFFDLKEKEIFIEKIDSCVDKIQHLINLCNQLDYRLKQVSTIKEGLETLINIRDSTIKYKEQVNNLFVEIEEKESLIYNKISSLKFDRVSENDLENYD